MRSGGVVRCDTETGDAEGGGLTGAGLTAVGRAGIVPTGAVLMATSFFSALVALVAIDPATGRRIAGVGSAMAFPGTARDGLFSAAGAVTVDIPGFEEEVRSARAAFDLVLGTS